MSEDCNSPIMFEETKQRQSCGQISQDSGVVVDMMEADDLDDDVFEECENSVSLLLEPSPSSSGSVSSETTAIEKQSEFFLKLVKTIQFVKKWARRAEREAEQRQNSIVYQRRMSKLSRDEESTSMLSVESDRLRDKIMGWLDKKNIRKCVVWDPYGNMLLYWMFVVSVAVVYNAFVVAVRETFHQIHGKFLPLWVFLDLVADLIYILDMWVQGTTSYLHQGLMVTNLTTLCLHYMKSHYFVLDVLSILPGEILYVNPSVGIAHTSVRINRFLRFLRVFQFLDRAESRISYSNAFRVFQLIFLITLIIHWNACVYFLISEGIGFGSDSWVYPNLTDANGNPTEFATLSRQYLFSFYWSTLTLTTIGELPGPVTDGEYLFVIIDFLIGVLIFATIVGMVGGIITNMNRRRTEFQENLDNMKQYMRNRHVDKHVRDRVIEWFDYQWTTNQTLNQEKILQSLPNRLQSEIAIHVHFETLKQVKIFEECEAGLLEELVLKLKPEVFSPGDYICRKGDVGREMYIIRHGRLEVVGDDGMTVYATLTDGGYFGEISVLNLGGNGNRRTANVRSVGYSDLFCLSKSDLLETLEEYPETKALLEERGNRTLMKDGTLEGSVEQLSISKVGVSASEERLEKKVNQLESNLEVLQTKYKSMLADYNRVQMKLKQRIYALETRDYKNNQ